MKWPFHIHTHTTLYCKQTGIFCILPFRPSCNDHLPISLRPSHSYSPVAWRLSGTTVHRSLQCQNMQTLLHCQVQILRDLCVWELSCSNQRLQWGLGCVKEGDILSWVREQAGHGERARARGKGGAQEDTHSSQLPTVIIFFATSQEKWMQCPQKLWAEQVLQGPAWRKVSPRSTVMVIWAYSYAPLS